MSDLINGVDRIRLWLQNNSPEIAESLQPGLDIKEIKQKTQWFPFKLSNEIFDLFQCISVNKASNIFGDGNYLLSPENSLRIYQDEGEVEYGEGLGKYFISANIPAFPLFVSPDCQSYSWAVCDDSEDLPIILLGWEDPELIICYTSLTNMILTLAEAYESNLFTLKTYNDGSKHIDCVDDKLFRKIQTKYDPEHKIRTKYKKQLLI